MSHTLDNTNNKLDQIFSIAIETTAGADSPIEKREALSKLWSIGIQTLDRLYGIKALAIIEKCNQVSPSFCLHVVTNIYGLWWDNPNWTDYQRSIITIVGLLAANQLKQFNMLVEIFLNCDQGSPEKLQSIVNFMVESAYINTSIQDQVLPLCGKATEDTKFLSLDSDELFLIDLASHVTLQKKFTPDLQAACDNKGIDNVKMMITHLIPYMGCPNVWNAIDNNFIE